MIEMDAPVEAHAFDNDRHIQTSVPDSNLHLYDLTRLAGEAVGVTTVGSNEQGIAGGNLGTHDHNHCLRLGEPSIVCVDVRILMVFIVFPNF